MCDMRQDEILMQEHIEHERKTGTPPVSPSTKLAGELIEELGLEYGEKVVSDDHLTVKQKQDCAIQQELDEHLETKSKEHETRLLPEL